MYWTSEFLLASKTLKSMTSGNLLFSSPKAFVHRWMKTFSVHRPYFNLQVARYPTWASLNQIKSAISLTDSALVGKSLHSRKYETKIAKADIELLNMLKSIQTDFIYSACFNPSKTLINNLKFKVNNLEQLKQDIINSYKLLIKSFIT